jgi:hypothetical protein
MRMRRWIGRLLLLTCSAALWLGLAELWLRRSVGACGRTPFRDATLAGLPHELAPGRATTYKGVAVRVNSLGFRGPELAPPPDGTERVALVGDSFTFGNGCREEETLTAALERELAAHGRAAQVVNCGVPAFNAQDVVALTKGRVLALHPQRVVYVLVANDVDASVKPGPIPPDAVIDPFAEFPLHSALLQWLGIEATGFLRATGLRRGGYVEKILAEWKGGGGERLDASLAELAAACTAAGARLTVAVYPFMVKPSRNPLAPIEADALARCARRGIDVVALVDAFEKDEDLTRYWITPLDAHPDARAHAAAARLLAERLAK